MFPSFFSNLSNNIKNLFHKRFKIYPNPTYPRSHFTRTRPARKIKNIFLPEPDLPENYFTRTRPARKIKNKFFIRTRLNRKIFYPTRPNPKNIGFFTGKNYFQVPMQDYVKYWMASTSKQDPPEWFEFLKWCIIYLGIFGENWRKFKLVSTKNQNFQWNIN